jgi:peptidyl-tRNA hydrolase
MSSLGLATGSNTRHALQYRLLLVDELRRAGVTFEAAPVNALVARVRLRNWQCRLFAAAHRELERRGCRRAVAIFRRPVDLLVVVDEVQLPLGRLRAGARGRLAATTGKSIIEQRVRTCETADRRGGDARRDLAIAPRD